MIEKWFESFTLLEHQTKPTGFGSNEGRFTPVMPFRGVVSCHTGSEVSAAGQMALKETPVLLYEVDVTLAPNDYVRRDRDGAVYRVCGSSDSMQAPAFSGLQFYQVGVERMMLPC